MDDRTGSGAVPLCRAKASWERNRSMPAGLTDDLRRRQRGAAWNRQQGRRQRSDPRGDRGGEFVDLDGQSAQVGDEAGGQVGDETGERRGVRVDLVESAGPVHFRGRCPFRVEFVQMPPQPGNYASAFGDQVFTVIDQQPDLAFDTVEAITWRSPR
ncbi:hypothetical protein [Rhodococcus ruber]|uniref:hypothetical protein n=1 Tax=Rhodococcus ruber TaxID=1830 RepID=UPI00190F8688|nr:hypothetical protein [Rhodococcus ruber]